MRNGQRTIKVNKSNLIEKIKENQANHIIEYTKAVIAYKAEAKKQLAELQEKLSDGVLKLNLNLTEPVNCAKNYESIIDMFEWEVEDEVELSQDEFKEYVQDETQFARMAKLSNQAYF